MKTQILCLWTLTEQQRSELTSGRTGCCDFIFSTVKTVTREQAQAAEVILGNIPPDLIKDSRSLKWIQLNSAGADKYTGSGILPRGTLLTNATGAYGQSVGEHIFAVMLMMMKNLHLYRDLQSKAVWADCGPVTTPEGAHIFIVGFGDIGRYFAQLCSRWGSHITGFRLHSGQCPDYADALYTIGRLDECLPDADVVVSILPGTKDSTGIWNKKRFSLMKKSALFINAGRGSAVNQDDLYDVLSSHTIAGAGIDVTVPEPLPADSKLWQLPNLVLTPHVAGEFHLNATFIRIFGIAQKNLGLYLDNKPLINLVDFTTGYRKAE